ncbi:L-threonylcarbamoyladenylate synthase [Mangrovihabitans endophyticus]|uniref:Threonylcarbamoyl-AMP synthase n=1 Tax=Mangrovihabitans endophyticus TaxID=1751298 RepID=A0A8J3FPY7_9ACTN|nr:L-threonylcarbamoyladenylate synthase [Mangrovihabitans endophyticus]GGK99262.1 threonylcarbamoyl-AMP synthase [Mangrovihabitans endophyticus]
MTAEVVRPDRPGLRRAADTLRAGSVCAFPTETVYGLGAHAFSRSAVEQVYRLKNRPTWNPLIVHVPSVAAARDLAAIWPAAADELAERFWPGPLTLVVRRSPGLNDVGRTPADTIAIRVPAHEVALQLLDACGLPLAAPSANRSEGISPTTARHVVQSLPEVPLVLDGGPCAYGIESTVLDLTEAAPRLLRPGALSLRALRAVAGPITVPDTTVADGSQRPSPGMSRRHYAPRAKVELVDEFPAAAAGGVLTYEGHEADAQSPRGGGPQVAEVLSADPREYAADLYAALHRLDDAGVDRILVRRPPDGEDWLAIRDRLGRAAA